MSLYKTHLTNSNISHRIEVSKNFCSSLLDINKIAHVAWLVTSLKWKSNSFNS